MNFIRHQDHATELWRPGVVTRMRVSALTGAKALTIFEQWCEPGLGAPIHWHPVEEVLTGLLELEIAFRIRRYPGPVFHLRR